MVRLAAGGKVDPVVVEGPAVACTGVGHIREEAGKGTSRPIHPEVTKTGRAY